MISVVEKSKQDTDCSLLLRKLLEAKMHMKVCSPPKLYIYVMVFSSKQWLKDGWNVKEYAKLF